MCKKFLFVFLVYALFGHAALSGDVLDSQSGTRNSVPASEPVPTDSDLLQIAAKLHPFDLELYHQVEYSRYPEQLMVKQGQPID